MLDYNNTKPPYGNYVILIPEIIAQAHMKQEIEIHSLGALLWLFVNKTDHLWSTLLNNFFSFNGIVFSRIIIRWYLSKTVGNENHNQQVGIFFI